MARVVQVAAEVLRALRPPFLKALAALRRRFVLVGRFRSRCRGGRLTQVVADHQAGQTGQIGSVALIVGVVRIYNYAAAGDLVAHVQQNVELCGGGLKVSRGKDDRVS